MGWSEWAHQTLVDLVVPLVAPVLACRDETLREAREHSVALDEVVEAARDVQKARYRFARISAPVERRLREALERLDAVPCEGGEHG